MRPLLLLPLMALAATPAGAFPLTVEHLGRQVTVEVEVAPAPPDYLADNCVVNPYLPGCNFSPAAPTSRRDDKPSRPDKRPNPPPPAHDPCTCAGHP